MAVVSSWGLWPPQPWVLGHIGFKSNQKPVGYHHSIHATIAAMGLSSYTGHYYSSESSQLNWVKLLMTPPPPTPQLPAQHLLEKLARGRKILCQCLLGFPIPCDQRMWCLSSKVLPSASAGHTHPALAFYLVTCGFWEELDALCRMIIIKPFYMNKHVCEVYKIIVILPHLDFPFPLPFLLPVSYTHPPLRSFFFFLPTISDGYSKWNTQIQRFTTRIHRWVRTWFVWLPVIMPPFYPCTETTPGVSWCPHSTTLLLYTT